MFKHEKKSLGQEALRITLKAVENDFVNWLTRTGNETRMLSEKDEPGRSVKLNIHEMPLYEYASDNNYSLVTTEKLISIKGNDFFEIMLDNIDQVRPVIKNENDVPPWTVLTVTNTNNDRFFMKFDSGTPTYFAFILINNLCSQLKSGKWYLNPEK